MILHRQLLLGLLVLAGCGGGGGSTGGNTSYPTSPNTPSTPSTPSTGSTSSVVSVQDNLFDPSATTVLVGATVTWNFSGGDRYGVATAHNVTFDDDTHSSNLSSGAYTRTFSRAGVYKYHCTIHGGAMAGQVTVQ